MLPKEPMTVAGSEKLRAELHYLKSVVRPKITEAIATARAHGDLKENGDYHAAREQQSFTEGKINDLEAALSNMQIIDFNLLPESAKNGRVIFGATVVLCDEAGKEIEYTIVGKHEADVSAGKINYDAPLARALISKMAGDEVTVMVAGRKIVYEVLDVKYI